MLSFVFGHFLCLALCLLDVFLGAGLFSCLIWRLVFCFSDAFLVQVSVPVCRNTLTIINSCTALDGCGKVPANFFLSGAPMEVTTVDGRNPAPPKKLWHDDSSVNTNQQWLPMVAR